MSVLFVTPNDHPTHIDLASADMKQALDEQPLEYVTAYTKRMFDQSGCLYYIRRNGTRKRMCCL